jgi:hypothetical protein
MLQALCHDFSLGFATKARAYKGVGLDRRPWVTFHAPRNIGECEEMNPHTPKWAPTLGVGVLMDFQIFRKKFQGSKFIRLKILFYY